MRLKSLLVLPAGPVLSRLCPHDHHREVVKEADLVIPNWMGNARARAEDIFDRELKIAEREREINRCEDQVNQRKYDASRRESWIME